MVSVSQYPKLVVRHDSEANLKGKSVLKTSCQLTYELHRFVQPRQDLLTKAVVYGNTQEVRLGNEVGFGTGVTGIEDICYVVLLHQIL